MAKVSGEVGSLFVHQLRNAVDMLNLEGAEISLWVGRGFFSKPFVIEGQKKEPLRRLVSWMEECTK
jgi:hypothetical protein